MSQAHSLYHLSSSTLQKVLQYIVNSLDVVSQAAVQHHAGAVEQASWSELANNHL